MAAVAAVAVTNNSRIGDFIAMRLPGSDRDIKVGRPEYNVLGYHGESGLLQHTASENQMSPTVSSTVHHAGWSRREILQAGTLGLMGLSMSDIEQLRAESGSLPRGALDIASSGFGRPNSWQE